jgi:hypothetical protein
MLELYLRSAATRRQDRQGLDRLSKPLTDTRPDPGANGAERRGGNANAETR